MAASSDTTNGLIDLTEHTVAASKYSTTGPVDPTEYSRTQLSGNLFGRDQELDSLNEACGSEKPGTLQIAAIQGIAGTGKTQLALHWAFSYAEQRSDCVVIFLEAARHTEIHESLMRFLRHCRRKIKITATIREIYRVENLRILTTTRKKLETSSRDWILIIDNVTDDTVSNVQELIPRRLLANRSGKVILTTRSPSVQNLLVGDHKSQGMVPLLLGGLDAASAVNFLDHLTKTESGAEIGERHWDIRWKVLLGVLGNIPLLIEQLAHFVAAYPKFEPKLPPEHAEVEAICMYDTSDYRPRRTRRSFFSAWEHRLYHIENVREVAADLLCILCFFHPQEIDINVIIRAFAWQHHEMELNQTMEARFLLRNNKFTQLYALTLDMASMRVVLENYFTLGILKRGESSDSAVSFADPLIQTVARRALMPDASYRRKWLAFSLRVLESGITSLQYTERESLAVMMSHLAPHLRSLWTHCQDFQICTVSLCAAHAVQGNMLEDAGKYREAIRWKECALRGLRSGYVIGADEVLVHEILLELGILYTKIASRNRNKDTLLEIAQNKVLESYRWFARETPLSAQSRDALRALASVYIEQQKPTELHSVGDLLYKAVNTLKNSAPTNEYLLETLQLNDAIVKVYACLARCDGKWFMLGDAHKLVVETMERKKELLGDQDSEIADSKEILAEVLWACYESNSKDIVEDDGLDFAEEAVKTLKGVLKWHRREDGKTHPETERVHERLHHWRSDLEFRKLRRADPNRITGGVRKPGCGDVRDGLR